jgi:drug/metabolite transporter (DMT)-like permease
MAGLFCLSNLSIFVTCVAIWGSTWLAITFQLGSVAPEASVFYRFLLASLLLFAFCRARGMNLLYDRRQHLALALQGLLMFSVGYVLVYYAEAHVVSGLVAVGYSASPLLNMLGVRLCFGTPMSVRVTLGALLGIAGITIVFWPEFGRMSSDGNVALGALYTALAVVISAAGSVAASRNRKLDLPVWQTMAWGMLYGAMFTLGFIAAAGIRLGFELSVPYALSLLYLAVFGSIFAFAGYLTLIGRIGAARAGYVGVMVPIVALVISALFEGYAWHAETWIGIALSLAGNVIILRKTQEPAKAAVKR